MATEKGAQRVFLGLLALSIGLLAVIVSPFAKAFFLAAVLAGAVYGLQRRLALRLRGRGALAAGILCVGVVLILVLPLAGLATFVVTEVMAGVDYLGETLRRDGVEGLLSRVPGPLQGLAERGVAWLEIEGRGLSAALQALVSARGAAAAQAATGAVAKAGSLLFQLVMMLIALFFFLLDGRRLVDWLESVSPLKRGQTAEILREFRHVSGAVLTSSLVTAGVQATAATVGYLIARVPAPLFFATVTFLFALIPAIGAAVVCLAAALLLLVTGHPWYALFLTVWGIVVVGLSDNIVKPLLVKRGMHVHGGVVFFALLGGLAVFGVVGLLLGPLIVSFFLALVRIYERDYGRAAPRPGDPATPPEPPTAPA